MKRLAIVLALVSLFMAMNLAHAQDPPMGGGMGGDMMGGGMMGAEHPLWKNLHELGLDEKQKEAAKRITRKTMKEVIKKRADMQIARLDLRDALDEDTVDMKAVESKLKAIESLETDIYLSHVKAIEEIKSILTPDQRKKLKEMMEKHPMMKKMGMMQGKGCGMMGGMSQHGNPDTTSSSAGGDEDKPEMEHAH
jgi:Spy/CpxP family protein refolding chaperone